MWPEAGLVQVTELSSWPRHGEKYRHGKMPLALFNVFNMSCYIPLASCWAVCGLMTRVMNTVSGSVKDGSTVVISMITWSVRASNLFQTIDRSQSIPGQLLACTEWNLSKWFAENSALCSDKLSRSFRRTYTPNSIMPEKEMTVRLYHKWKRYL